MGRADPDKYPVRTSEPLRVIIILDTTRRDRAVRVFECACGIQRQCIGQGGIGCQPQSAAIRTQLKTSFFGLTVELRRGPATSRAFRLRQGKSGY
jgi:hypothetical protein